MAKSFDVGIYIRLNSNHIIMLKELLKYYNSNYLDPEEKEFNVSQILRIAIIKHYQDTIKKKVKITIRQ